MIQLKKPLEKSGVCYVCMPTIKRFYSLPEQNTFKHKLMAQINYARTVKLVIKQNSIRNSEIFFKLVKKNLFPSLILIRKGLVTNVPKASGSNKSPYRACTLGSLESEKAEDNVVFLQASLRPHQHIAIFVRYSIQRSQRISFSTETTESTSFFFFLKSIFKIYIFKVF